MVNETILSGLSELQRRELETELKLFMQDDVISNSEWSFLHDKAVEFGLDVSSFDEYVNSLLAEKKAVLPVVDRKKELVRLVDICLQDNVLTEEERSFLIGRADQLGFDVKKFSKYLNKRVKECRTNQKASSGNRSGSFSAHKWLLSVFVVVLIGAALYYYFVLQKSNGQKPVSLTDYIESNPELIFQGVSLKKYIVFGTPDPVLARNFKMKVFQVSANVYYAFDLSKLKVNNIRTNEGKGELNMSYVSDTFFPLTVDVDIPQSDIVQVYEYDIQAITEEEAKSIAKPVAVACGAMGAWFGGKLGKTVGSIFGTKGTGIGQLLGAASIGGAAATSSYVFTKKFFTGLQLSSNINVEQTEEFLCSAKQMIAMEMLSLNAAEDEMFQLRKRYEDSIREQLNDVAKKFGWKTVKVNFKYE